MTVISSNHIQTEFAAVAQTRMYFSTLMTFAVELPHFELKHP